MLWFLALLPLVGFWTYGLFDLDEGIYAASLREMIERNDWVSITYGGAPFFEKPILIYWLSRIFLVLGLPDSLALRLPSILAAIGTYWIVFRFVKPRFGVEKAYHSVMVLALSPLVVVMARMFTPDSLLMFFLTGSYLFFWESLKKGIRYRVLSLLFLGFAVLAKGPYPVVVFLLLVLLVAITMPDRRRMLREGWGFSILGFLLVIASWYLPVYLINGEAFFKEFIVYQNLGRFFGGDTAHLGPVFSYIPVLVLATMPFLFVVIRSFRNRHVSDLQKFLWWWVILIFLLFSLSGTKLPHYVLPILPPIAILFGIELTEMSERMRWGPRIYGFLLGFGMIGIGLSTPGLPVDFFLIGIVTTLILCFLTFSDGIGPIRNPSFSSHAISVAAAIICPIALIGIPQYWNQTHGDVKRIAIELKGKNKPIFEYRNDGMSEKMVTSQPSFQWYLGASTDSGNFLDQLYEASSEQILVISRRNRLGGWQLKALKLAGIELTLNQVVGEFQIYSSVRDVDTK